MNLAQSFASKLTLSMCALVLCLPFFVHAQSYVPMYEEPWSTPGEYEYQYTMSEGLVPPSYYDYSFAPAHDTYTYSYSAPMYYDAYAGSGAYDMFDTGYGSVPNYVQNYDSGYYYPQAYTQAASSFQPYVTPYDSVAAARILNCRPEEVRWRQDEIHGGVEYYIDGSSNTSTTTSIVAPSCRLTPKSTGTGTVILEWTTNNATTAFIDNGIGHVSLGTAGRMVTPNVSTVYNMTVVNARGASAQCAANIIVKGTAPVGSSTLTIDRSGAQQYYDAQGNPIVSQVSGSQPTTNNQQPTTPVQSGAIQYDEDGNVIDAVTEKAEVVGGNVLEKITDTLGSGQSIWERIRVISMIALGIFIVLAIVVFVMRKMFGGGGEAH